MLEAARLERVEYAIVLPEGRIAIQVPKNCSQLGLKAALAVMNGHQYHMQHLPAFIDALERSGALSFASNQCVEQFNLLKGKSNVSH